MYAIPRINIIATANSETSRRRMVRTRNTPTSLSISRLLGNWQRKMHGTIAKQAKIAVRLSGSLTADSICDQRCQPDVK
jgi:hypothetical protein